VQDSLHLRGSCWLSVGGFNIPLADPEIKLPVFGSVLAWRRIGGRCFDHSWPSIFCAQRVKIGIAVEGIQIREALPVQFSQYLKRAIYFAGASQAFCFAKLRPHALKIEGGRVTVCIGSIGELLLSKESLSQTKPALPTVGVGL